MEGMLIKKTRAFIIYRIFLSAAGSAAVLFTRVVSRTDMSACPPGEHRDNERNPQSVALFVYRQRQKGVRMYLLKTEADFDSAHFLAGYDGKCHNIHGHRWKVVVTICAEALEGQGQTRGMLVDFSTLKDSLREEAGSLDHTFIIEKGSLRCETLRALKEEGFSLFQVPFRPTAENLARYFYQRMKARGYAVKQAEVYETPVNCAVYSGE